MANSITLYTCDGTPNPTKACIAFEELGLDYRAHQINIMKGEQKEPAFLEINPNGRVPALQDGNLRVFESGAILLYLADKYDHDHKISYAHGTNDYYETLSWLFFQMAGIGPMQGQANHFLFSAKVRSEYAIERYMAETKRLYTVLESRLSSHDWLAGEKFTIADIACYSWVRNSDFLDISLNEFPGVAKWHVRISARETVKKAVTLPHGMKSMEERKAYFAGLRKRIESLGDSDKT